MKKSILIFLLLLFNLSFQNPLHTKEILEDKNLIEKVSFDIYWDDKYTD